MSCSRSRSHGLRTDFNDNVDEEATDFQEIRIACLPEIILAYNTILNFSARYVSRDTLLKSMDLLPLIADDDSDLAPCLIKADRMPELVNSFAWTSKNMIMGSEAGGKRRKGKDGKTLDLWTVRKPAESSGSA